MGRIAVIIIYHYFFLPSIGVKKFFIFDTI